MSLFEGPAPRVRAIPASAPFLETLVAFCVASLRRADDPFALADALILLPNRRAVRGLMDAFADHLGGAALLPAIRPLGDLEDDPDVWGAEPWTFEAPRAVDPLQRRLELAAFVRKREEAAGGVDDPVRALAYADALCRLMDAAAASGGVDWSKLSTLVDSDLAQHWRQSAEFLEIITTYWPQRLAADRVMDPGARRAFLVERLAAHWREAPPQTPVIIAGSTGSVAATRLLMQTVAGLPKGVVVLPGLDAELDDGAWAQINAQHPQFALKRTLDALGVDRRAVRPLSPQAESVVAAARRALIREALAPAPVTADWLKRIAALGGADALKSGAEGLSLIEAATEDEEAALIAIAMREAVEEAQSAALVTPDAALGRRVAAKLARWAIKPAMSQGERLNETAAGGFLLALAGLAVDPPDPVLLAFALKHPLSGLEMAAALRAERRLLRGPARFPDWEALCAADPARAGPIVALLEKLAPLRALAAQPRVSFSAYADALALAAESLSDGAVWRGLDGAAASDMLRGAIAHGDAVGETSAPAALRMIEALMREIEIAPARDGDPRVAILGPLEARLQRRDLLILGGLNEGAWPAPGAEDPFLSRGMRAHLGLGALEERIGLAAHDFAQLANAPRVLITRAQRAGSAPATASRWLWRLTTLLRAAAPTEDVLASAASARLVAYARALDAPAVVAPAAAPRPAPPAEARLAEISVTGVSQLIRDPYAVYARRILKLRVLDPIGKRAGAAERGTAIHNAIEALTPDSDADAFLALLDMALAKAGMPAAARAADLLRIAPAARAYIAWLGERARAGWRGHVEKTARLDLPVGVALTGRADRIDLSLDGEASIVDVKSGQAKTVKQVQSGLEPQLPLEAALLARGAFADTPAARARELIYWSFTASDYGPQILKLERGAHEEGEEALRNLEALLARYAEPAQPFLSKPRVQFAQAHADYDHLARRQEWADSEFEE